jgi:fatty acid desaturase
VFPYDLSSTMPYQRNSWLGFLHYWARFSFGSWVELPYHCWRKNNLQLFVQACTCSILFFTVMITGFSIDAVGTLMVFAIPFVIVSFALMFGNWSQHIFVDPEVYEKGHAKDETTCNYSLTFNTMNHWENTLTFNDGFHIVHHRWATLHWSEMPQRFVDDLENHAKHDALVFQHAGPLDIGFAVMTGNWDYVTSRYVHYGQTDKPRSPEEIRVELERRLKPIEVEKLTPLTY